MSSKGNSHLFPTDDIIRLIKDFEPFRPIAEFDASAYPPRWVIGYGDRIQEGEYSAIDQTGAHNLLVHRLYFLASCVKELVDVALTRNQFSALLSFVHQLGPETLEGSNLLLCLNRGNFKDASQQFAKWTEEMVYGKMEQTQRMKVRRTAERVLFNREDNENV